MIARGPTHFVQSVHIVYIMLSNLCKTDQLVCHCGVGVTLKILNLLARAFIKLTLLRD